MELWNPQKKNGGLEDDHPFEFVGDFFRFMMKLVGIRRAPEGANDMVFHLAATSPKSHEFFVPPNNGT